MPVPDAEIDAMQGILRLLGSLDPDAQRRVSAWVYARFGPDVEPTVGSADGSFFNPPASDVRAFIRERSPSTAVDRLLCLVYWSERHGDRDVAIRWLNELNRDAGGHTFSDASSVAQSAIKKGYLRRAKPGHLVMTAQGRARVRSMQGPGSAPLDANGNEG